MAPHLFPATTDRKQLPNMKLFPNNFVFMSERNVKLNVAEKPNDYNDYKETAPR
jgi:hypothetical protein